MNLFCSFFLGVASSAWITFVCTLVRFDQTMQHSNRSDSNVTYSIPLIITIIKFIVVPSKSSNLLNLLPIVNMIAEDWVKLKADR